MNPKRVLLIGGNYKPELTGIGKYNGEMIEWLANNGHPCTIITTYPYYPEWKTRVDYSRKKSWFSTEHTAYESDGSETIYRCPHYVPANPSGLKRMISDLTFFVTAFLRMIPLFFGKKHDYILSVAPPFHVGILALLYKLIRGGKVVYHVQDLQIDAARELGMIKNKMLLKIMFGIERFILRRADYVSTISLGMKERVRAKVRRKVIFFPNWVKTHELFPMRDKTALKEKFGLDPARKVVLYSGAIGEKQGLEAVIHAAGMLKEEPINFVICGNGPYRLKLEALAASKKLDNVIFLPLQEKALFNEFLNAADLHLVLQKKNANELVMPSKLTGILSVGGLALVTADSNSGLYKYIEQNDIALLAEAEDTGALVNAISRGLFDSTEHISANARTFATTDLNIELIMSRFMEAILPPQVIGGGVIIKTPGKETVRRQIKTA